MCRHLPTSGAVVTVSTFRFNRTFELFLLFLEGHSALVELLLPLVRVHGQQMCAGVMSRALWVRYEISQLGRACTPPLGLFDSNGWCLCSSHITHR